MAELARVHGIKVIIAAVLPADRYPWIPAIKPAQQIVALNKLIKAYAESHGLVYLDYHTPMVNEGLGLKREYSTDGVHPVAAGYKLMTELVEQAIQTALRQR